MGSAVVCGIDEKTHPRVREVAVDLADRLALPLVLTHVVPEPQALAFAGRGERDGAHHRSLLRGQEVLRRIGGPGGSGREPGIRVARGGALQGVLDTVEYEDAELLVVGSRGRGPLFSALFGSVSRALARRAPCPVVVVPLAAAKEDAHDSWAADKPGATVLCGVSALERARSVRFAAQLADRLGHRLVAVLEDREATSREVVAELPPTAKVVECAGPLGPCLETVARAEQARLIAVGAPHSRSPRSLLVRWSQGGLLRHAPVPVVVLPDEAKGALLPGNLTRDGFSRLGAA